MQINANGDKVAIKLSKSEVRRLLEAEYIMDRILWNADLPSNEIQAWGPEEFAHAFGSEHLDEGGRLKETPRTQAVNESAPKEPEPTVPMPNYDGVA